MNIRHSAVAGTFYPGSCDEINRYIKRFNEVLDEGKFDPESELFPRAVISPHAGYIYSGFTANMAFRTAAYNNLKVKRVIVIGPSHKAYIDGASIALYDTYETPCAELKIDLELSKRLEAAYGFLQFSPGAHSEHSTEVQMPFVQHYFPHAEVIEIVYGQVDFMEISHLIDDLLKDEENFIVISTDLSHFYTKSEAKALDTVCLSAIQNLDLEQFERGCEACGIIGVKAIINSAVKCNLKSSLLDYRTSADTTGDESNVVGYTSALLGTS